MDAEHSQLNTLAKLINDRHTVRKFLPEPVPREVLEKALSIAQRTASNNNLQPWRAVILTGEKLESLNKAMLSAWDEGWPDIPETPADYIHHKEDFGAELYGKLLGIGRDDHEKRKTTLAENFRFYGATAAIIVYMDNRLSKYDLISAGLWMQNLTLALRAQGIEACYQASVAGYAEILQRELDLPEGVNFLSAIAIGYEDVSYVGNTLRMTRDHWARNVQIR
ncbi:Nitroreductase-like protein [Trichoderma sp. SZMC 28015]